MQHNVIADGTYNTTYQQAYGQRGQFYLASNCSYNSGLSLGTQATPEHCKFEYHNFVDAFYFGLRRQMFRPDISSTQQAFYRAMLSQCGLRCRTMSVSVSLTGTVKTAKRTVEIISRLISHRCSFHGTNPIHVLKSRISNSWLSLLLWFLNAGRLCIIVIHNCLLAKQFPFQTHHLKHMLCVVTTGLSAAQDLHATGQFSSHVPASFNF